MILQRIKRIRNRYLGIFDALLTVFAVFGAFAVRFELGYTFYKFVPVMKTMMVVAVILRLTINFGFGLYRRLWSHAGITEIKLILAAAFCGSVAIFVFMVILHRMGFFVGFPRSVFVIEFLFSLCAMAGIRYFIRFVSDLANERQNHNIQYRRRAIIVGAGDAGVLVLKEINRNPQLGVKPICFVDDDSAKRNLMVHTLKVEGTIADLHTLIPRYEITHCYFAIPSAPGATYRAVSDICRTLNVEFMTMPGIYNILDGKVSVNSIRKVDITDLLRRKPVDLNAANIRAILQNRVVMVSGAGGSIGRELCLQIANYRPKQLIIFGHGENSIFETLNELKIVHEKVDVVAKIADIRDENRLRRLFEQYQPEIVFHAAAHKHVPLMEDNALEAVTNNVFGTYNMAHIANQFGVKRFVMISTDKAVRPINVMGATKRLAENFVLNEANFSEAKFTAVRFGNVLGSRGSVVPIFQKQIEKGGPVTITHPEMRRYFMTIPEAVYLVLESAALATQKETFVLNMGEQTRILDLAEDLIRFSGLRPGSDIEIKYTGIRPGEKLLEDLWDEGQVLDKTRHRDIFMLQRRDLLSPEKLEEVLVRLREFVESGNVPGLINYFNELIPDAHVETLKAGEVAREI